jgi:hypothetical protein
MKAKIIAILIAAVLLGCTSSKENNCKLDARYTFNFEQAQYYALPPIDFSFNLSYDYLVRMPEFGKQNFNYYEVARYNDDSTGSVLLKVHPFKRQGAYISVKEQRTALIMKDLQIARRDSWVTEKIDTVDQWYITYGRYEQDPEDYIIGHTLIMRDSLSNGLLLELQMPCPIDSFDLKREKCLEEVVHSFKVYL